MRTGIFFSSLWLCLLCGCNLYDEGRVGSAWAISAPDAAVAASSSTSTGANSSAGSETMPVSDVSSQLRESEPDSCDPEKDCFWWENQGSCRSASPPSLEARPRRVQSDPELAPIVLAWTQLKLTPNPPNSSEMPSFGLDLDHDCTNAPGCSSASVGSCHPRPQGITSHDGDGCRDNTYANLWQVASMLPLLGKQLGLSESQLSCELRRGTYNMLVRLSGYNGRPNDADVRVDFYASPGLEHMPSWSCVDGIDVGKMPIWEDGAAFRVGQGELLGSSASASNLPDSKYSDPHAYVRSGFLVARLPEDASLRLAGDGQPFRGLHLPLSGGLWMGKLSQTPSARWELKDGLVAGRTSLLDVQRSWNESGLCPDIGFDMFYKTLLEFADASADVLASGAYDPSMPCDAVSVGIAFEAKQATVSGSAPLEPLVMCCKPGVSSEDCQAVCGDGKVSGPESCDTALAGSCPTRCQTTDPCKRALLQGSECSAHCVIETITRFIPGDGCCPTGASPAQDTDCKSSVCGNGVLDPGETCDPKDSCPECPTYNACLSLTRTGDKNTCTLACSYKAITGACKPGDGCCPEGCDHAQDSDCSDKCGDGVVQPELGETCENGTDKPCPTSCDDGEPCTEDVATGSVATCNRLCTHIPILQPISGDRCCPKGIHANANTDSDCAAVCGNGVIEPGEGCDDGNLDNKDSCSKDCQPIDQLDMCLTQVGSRDACTECVCKQCQAEASRCYAGARADQNDTCTAAARCFNKHRCRGPECYCGGDLLNCEASPSGPCRKEIEAAAQTDVASIISVRSLDSNFPIGRANAIGECAWQSCSDFCGAN